MSDLTSLTYCNHNSRSESFRLEGNSRQDLLLVNEDYNNEKVNEDHNNGKIDCHNKDFVDCTKKADHEVGSLQGVASTNKSIISPSNHLLSICCYCKKKVEDGKDIYMYSEKAFCSHTCRDQFISVEKEMGNDSPINSPISSCSEGLFFIG